MKTLLLILCSLVLASCGLESPAEWNGTANPLNTPAADMERPAAMGRFGPHSEYFN
jgi:hypothetical protein